MAPTRLDELRRGACLTIAEFCDRFTRMAAQIGEKATISEPQARRWMSQATASRPRPQAVRVLQHWWRHDIDVLLAPAASEAGEARAVRRARTEELLMMAGRESSTHARHAAASLDPTALEGLHAEAARLARYYLRSTPITLLPELGQLRDTVYAQLEITAKPAQRAELYLIAGQVCGLLSSVAFDLGHLDSADELARAALTYGNVIDHPTLCSWARSLTLTTLLWAGRHREMLRVADDALRMAPAGTIRGRVHAIRARAYAGLGAEQDTIDDLTRSERELDRAGDDPLADEVGGELGFDRSRRALSAASAYLVLGDGRRAAAEAESALELAAGLPASQRFVAGELSTRVDLATARALSGDLAGSEDALLPVWQCPAENRTAAVDHRIHHLGGLLAGGSFAGSVEAARIRDSAQAFTAQALPATARTLELPAAGDLPGG